MDAKIDNPVAKIGWYVMIPIIALVLGYSIGPQIISWVRGGSQVSERIPLCPADGTPCTAGPDPVPGELVDMAPAATSTAPDAGI